MNLSNLEIAKKLREVAAAYTINGASIFQIRAYDTAASVIEHLSIEVQDLWEEGKLDQIPRVGPNIQSHLEELFKTGSVKHWEEVKKKINPAVFELLGTPGVGPRTAEKLTELGVKNREDLKKKIENSELVNKGFSDKLAQKILTGINQMSRLNEGRVLLPYAFVQAEKILKYLKLNPQVIKANALGSLRRMAATIGDIDFSVSTNDTKGVVEYILNMPGILRVDTKGENRVTLQLNSGFHLDLYIVKPTSYGAMLQHFTGSKQHNIHLRTIAEDKGFSLSEYGIKKIKSGEVIAITKEEEIYNLLNMQTPPPELREDTGEIEAALKNSLPNLVRLEDIKGDLHIHSSYNIEPSHDLGVNSISEIVKQAKDLGYKYIGIADHSPSISNHSGQDIYNIIRKRNEVIDKENYSSEIKVLKLLEVDILSDGKISVPEDSLKTLDFAIAGVHSSHRQPKDQMTERILKALSNPYVKVLSHPTGRILNERGSYDVDWERIFKFAAENKKAMEINAYPDRLDLPDMLVKFAKSFGVKFVINTDTHAVDHMENMLYGVFVARRGWLEKEDIINTWDFDKFANWFDIR